MTGKTYAQLFKGRMTNYLSRLDIPVNLKDSRLILVSNAEPYTHRWKNDEIIHEKLAGGLTSALDPLMKETGGVWIAWGRGEADFEVLDSDEKIKVPDESGYELKRIKLSEEEIEGFYLGFSNEILWPLFHSFPERVALDELSSLEKNWKIYRQVNQKYADAILKELEEGDLIWIHDYHLPLVPELVRDERPDANIGFFWHIAWPSWEMFGRLPCRKEMMDGLSSSNIIGFHTALQAKNFLSCAEKMGRKMDKKGSRISSDWGKTKVVSFPLGIDYEWFNSLSKKKDFRERARKLRKEISAEKILLAVDRLDYIKGIPQRLKAFELFLEENPKFKEKVTLVQRIPPSRSSIDEYKSILRQIHKIVGRINGKFEKLSWTPVKSFHRFLPEQEQLIPYYSAADACLITSLRDGMNLVAKEFVACSDEGVLILSEFTGAAEELEGAIRVNPHNAREVARGIKEALTMSADERRRRLGMLKKHVKGKDLKWWREKYMGEWLKA